MDIKIEEISPLLPEVKDLFRLLDEHNLSHCPPEICHLTQPDQMKTVDSTLLGVFCDGKLAGMGGLKYFKDYAEITRMFTLKTYRGKGLAAKLIAELESRVIKRNLKIMKLETSEKFVSAVALYKRLGFEKCDPFGEYIDKPFNSYYHKLVDC